MIETEKYSFSFTTSSLRLNKMILVAIAITEKREIDYINELGGGNSKTGRKMLSEFEKRISNLTPRQTDILVNGDFLSQKQIAFLSICKTYLFIRDFVVEVLREKILVFDYQITEGDYISFYRRKLDLHPEMDSLTDITQKKIKQVTFKILEQAGIIDSIKSKVIQPQIIDRKVTDAIVSDNPNWLKVLFISDMDITTMRK
ncbi:DUF1819 family protein [Flavobacterium xueshanense]|uniref:Putative inner membrane protein n=1 Tax=Flavobacterium xueshanense TaxID=935223 RepID=A0A1I2IPK4_9FLAO|nr:DUF1819 family protein [Flavobacterium xueshanense]SFF42766.1 Putative inner membrane protein [Flavobacterium xueshanense]